MAITHKTRKFLWAKSGNTCAFCKTQLISNNMDSTEFNIGEECHIISSKPTGPRHVADLKDYDNYENLLLLCKNHHKEIDELVDTYTEELLRYIKTNHENWVKKVIAEAAEEKQKDQKPKFLMRITSGKDLFNIVNEVHAYNTDYEDAKDSAEAQFIGDFIQTLIDYGDISSMLEPYDKVQIGFELQKVLDDLDQKGYYVFGEKTPNAILPQISKKDKWTVANVVVRKKENPEIITLDI
jgi:hypothetical protein